MSKEKDKCFPKTSGRRGRGGKREDLEYIYFRSSWEANYARILNLLVASGEIIKWEYEPETFEFSGIKRGSRFYTPDFKVYPAGGCSYFVEIKGYMDKKSKTKLRRMKKYHPEIELRLIERSEYKDLEEEHSHKIPNWESR